jgi:hypothetical protein
MSKQAKSTKSKIPAFIKIDPDLYKKACKICHKESIRLESRVTFSSKAEDLIREWVEKTLSKTQKPPGL